MSELTIARLRANYVNKVFAAFSLRRDDVVVAVTDPGVDNVCRMALELAISDLQQQGFSARLVMSEVPTGPAQDFGPEVEAAMEPATVLLYHTSKSRSHCPQSKKFVLSDRTGRERARCISITNGFADTLLAGAVNEDLDAMRTRIARANQMMAGVEKYHITTATGTNLWVWPWQEMMVLDNGLIDAPGKLGNFPFGEACSVAVKFYGTTGILISDGVVGAGIGQVDEPIVMTIGDGKIVDILGGEAKRKLVASMDEADAKLRGHHLPQPSRWIAEVAFGANAAAWRVDARGMKALPPTSLEAEKAYDSLDTSMHIAHGANHVFGVPEDAYEFNPVQHHTDHVLWGRLTVDAYFRDDTEMRIIDHGAPVF